MHYINQNILIHIHLSYYKITYTETLHTHTNSLEIFHNNSQKPRRTSSCSNQLPMPFSILSWKIRDARNGKIVSPDGSCWPRNCSLPRTQTVLAICQTIRRGTSLLWTIILHLRMWDSIFFLRWACGNFPQSLARIHWLNCVASIYQVTCCFRLPSPLFLLIFLSFSHLQKPQKHLSLTSGLFSGHLFVIYVFYFSFLFL